MKINSVSCGHKVYLDDSFLPTKDVFALKVKDDSMVGSGILDGDYVLARRQHNAETGDILVFTIGNEITVKKYDTKGDKVLLISANEAYETRIIKKNSSDLQIVGKVIGLLRKY